MLLLLCVDDDSHRSQNERKAADDDKKKSCCARKNHQLICLLIFFLHLFFSSPFIRFVWSWWCSFHPTWTRSFAHFWFNSYTLRAASRNDVICVCNDYVARPRHNNIQLVGRRVQRSEINIKYTPNTHNIWLHSLLLFLRANNKFECVY